MENMDLKRAFWQDRPTFVTGGTGLVGSWLVRRLVASGADVVCLVRDWVPQSELVRTGTLDHVKAVRGDIRDREVLERTLGEYEIDTVVHLAAQTIVTIANRNPISTFETNIAGTWNLLEACRRSPKVKQVVIASSDKAYGDTGVFSFHGSKTVTTGEGGMLVTDREDLFKRIQVLRDHGRQPGDHMFWNTEVAYKYKMSSMQAALGLAQLERIDELIQHKREQFHWYKQELAGVDGITLNAEPVGVLNAYWMVTIVLDPELGLNKTQLMERLSLHGIDTRPFFHPLSSIPAYEDSEQAHIARQRNKVVYGISPYSINLPSALSLGKEEIKTVCKALKELL
jgi:hypothetical protein